MSVHYKFKSALEYDTVTFDGLHISVKDLKNAIIQQKRIGKNTDFDLQVTNAQTKEIYEDEEALIPKNTSLLIARIPVIPSNKSKTWDGYGNDNTPVARTDEGGPIAKAVDLSSLDASEDDKIRAMMSQSTQDYDPSNYLKIRGANQVGTVPPNYRCYKCHQTGHWIKDCPLSQGSEPMEIKKSTGIPRSFMVPVEGPQVQGAMMTPNGSYAVPVLDHQTYTQKQPVPPPVQEEQPEIPEDLICSICSGLLTDAVMIPCCGNSFCDECIRSCLLESEEHECPDCHERDISPGTLIPNRYLRNSVANFKNTTGYVKKPTYKSQPPPQQQTVTPEIEKKEQEPVKADVKEPEVAESNKAESVEKTVISEADSTEPPKNINVDSSKEADPGDVSKESPSKLSVSEGPPGVSPRREKSPKRQSSRRGSHSTSSQNNGRPRRSSKDISPRPHATHRTPPYEPLSRIEERPGTPTVDEPGGSNVGNNVYPPTSAPYPSGPPPGILPPMIGMPPPHLQGPPPNYSAGQPPPGVFSNQGPPPNFRLPPPGANPPAPFVPGPYNAPPRPIFDPTRPPMQGPPQNYSNYPPRSRNRDYRESSRMRTRTPPGIIDDPLEAFNRMLREKDERDRRAKQKKGRSYSRSSSRSYSRSPKRPRSRSPRRRNSRSRSRSFSMSRSRSRSFSPSPRNSPYRDYSPRNSSPRRRPPSRFRSPARSPPARYRYKDAPPINDRNRDRDFDRPPPQRERERERERERDRGYSRDRDFNYFDRQDRGPRWGAGAPSRPIQDNYYPPEVHQLQPPPPSTNRYPPRDNYQPYINKSEPPPHHLPPILPPPAMHAPPQRRFEDIAPPGTDQPPIPGEELPPRYDERYPSYQQEQPAKERFGNERDARNKEEDRRNFDRAPNREEDKNTNKRFDRYSRSPIRGGYKSPRKSRERHESLDKHKRRKRGEHSEEKEISNTNREKRDDRHERKRETSDDEKSKRNKDKKKKREKKEMEKKKRREKKEKKEHDKAKKEEKDKDKKRDKDDGDEKEGSLEREHGVKEKEKEGKEKMEVPSTPEKLRESPKIERVEKVEKVTGPADLYDDLLSDGVDKSIVKNYGKLDTITRQDDKERTPEMPKREEIDDKDDNEYPPESETSKDEDVLDIHANEAELKAELEKSEVLAPLPEKSKWEMDDDVSILSVETQKEGKQERNGKVTTEVLKRAENAIFAKAINAIRPIEIKKISMDRAKLYSGEREKERKSDDSDMRNIQVTISSAYDEEVATSGVEVVKVESEIQKPPQRLSVKERLGVKVDDLERIVKVQYDRNRSRSLSPLSKRAREEKLHLDRRMEDERRSDRNRNDRDRYHRNFRNLDRGEFRRREEFLRRERDRREEQRRENRHERSHSRKEEVKRKRTRSRSESKDLKHRKKDKKQKKDKTKKHKRDEKEETKTKEDSNKGDKKEDGAKPKTATDRRKPTLDEANFEPDYDLESESEKEEKKSAKETPIEEEKKRFKPEEKEKESSSSESSDSSSEDDRKRKKHRKHKKKKSRKETSSSSSSSESDSSEEERERKRKKHKKKQKKKKKSKHK